MERFRRRVLLTFLLMVVILMGMAMSIMLRLDVALDSASAEARTLWNERGSPNYRMTLVTIGLPIPPVAVALTVEGGQIVRESIASCENPSEEFPVGLCELTRQYYEQSYTIEQLFDTADACIYKTLTVLSHCPAYIRPEFQYLSTEDALSEVVDTCHPYFRSGDFLCAVTYDPDYGYPKELYLLLYGASDGGSHFSVRNFEIIEE